MSPTRQLTLDEVHRALDDVDPVALVVAELAGRDVPERCFVEEPEAGPCDSFAERHVAVEDPGSATRFLLPLHALQALRGACLAAAAARIFVPPGAATVSVLGSGLAAELFLRMVARYVAGVSQVTVCTIGGSLEKTVTPRVVDELDLSGISHAVATQIGEATYGANLVGIVGRPVSDLKMEQIAKGAVIVNGSGFDLPPNVVDGVSKIYVDNMRLIDDNRDRHFVRRHASNGVSPAVGRYQPHRPRRIAGDLSALLRGDLIGRAEPEGVVLVEVLSAGGLSASLAYQLTMAAQRLGLGSPIPY